MSNPMPMEAGLAGVMESYTRGSFARGGKMDAFSKTEVGEVSP